MVFIQKKGYLPITFPLNISKKNPFYTNVVNLFTLPKYSPLPLVFNDLSVSNDLFLLHTMNTGSFLLVDSDFKIIHRIQTMYVFIGGLYFTDGNNILNYSEETEKFFPVIDRGTGLALQCKDISYYGDKLFCHDTQKFVGPKTSDIREKIFAINDHIVVTPKYIYNQDVVNTSWKYFEYQTGSINLPEAIVHINKIPYFFEKGTLSPVDKINTETNSFTKTDWEMDTLSQAQELNGETILLGEKQKQGKFLILDTEKEYSGIFDFERTEDVRVSKISGAYIFTTSTAAYIYYKGAKEIVKILDGVNIIRMVDAKIFFTKEGKNYVVDLLRKDGK